MGQPLCFQDDLHCGKGNSVAFATNALANESPQLSRSVVNGGIAGGVYGKRWTSRRQRLKPWAFSLCQFLYEVSLLPRPPNHSIHRGSQTTTRKSCLTAVPISGRPSAAEAHLARRCCCTPGQQQSLGSFIGHRRPGGRNSAEKTKPAERKRR